MSALTQILTRQRAWARSRGIEMDPSDYTARLEDNLFCTPSARTIDEFGGGAGQELTDGQGGKPAKMRALESSSALVVNVFDYLRQTNPEAIRTILGIGEPVAAVRFEAEFPTGLRGTPPTLDIAVTGRSGHIWGVESKFCEPYRSQGHRDPFVAAYLPDGEGLWEAKGLPRCERLARDLGNGLAAYNYLDAAQLLKHALGLFNQDKPATLFYLWYDEPPQGRTLKEELALFADQIDHRLGFRSVTYQELQQRVRANSEASHTDYLANRYFSVRQTE